MFRLLYAALVVGTFVVSLGFAQSLDRCATIARLVAEAQALRQHGFPRPHARDVIAIQLHGMDAATAQGIVNTAHCFALALPPTEVQSAIVQLCRGDQE